MIQVGGLQFIFMNLCVGYVSAINGAWIYRATKRFYQDCKYKKKRKIQSKRREEEYSKCSEVIEVLKELYKDLECAKITTVPVPSTEIQRATWHSKNETLDNIKSLIAYKIELEKLKADKRAELK